MRRALLLTLLFVSSLCVAQDIQNSFFGFKLDYAISEDNLFEHIKKNYSREVSYKNENPLNYGITVNLNFGGTRWDYLTFTIFQPRKTLHSVELNKEAESESEATLNYNQLSETLRDKYGEPTTKKGFYLLWEGKNGVNVSLDLNTDYPNPILQGTAYRSIFNSGGYRIITLKYWSVTSEKRLEQYNKEQL